MPSSTTTTNPSRSSSNTTSTTATSILSGERMTNVAHKDSTARTPIVPASDADTTALTRQTPSTTDSSVDAKKWPYDILEGYRYKCLLCGNIRSMGRRVNHATAQRHVLAAKFQNHSVWLQNNPWVRATKEANASSETGNNDDEDENSADRHDQENDQENDAVDELNGEDEQDKALQPNKA
jgi:hypothetical protein